MISHDIINSVSKSDCTTVNFSEGRIIISQDCSAGNLFLIKKGTVKAFHSNERGQEFLLAIFGKDEIFGELEFFTKTSYLASVEAISDCELVKISYSVFEKILILHPHLLWEISSELAVRLLNISRRTVEYSFFPLEYLISKYLMNEYLSRNISNIEISKNNLASYFGTNLRSINRVFKKLVDEKILIVDKNQINILSSKKLKILLDSFL